MEEIGYQDGIKSFFDWYRKQPGVPQRGPAYDPNDIDTWPWPDKLERTLKILKEQHDAEAAGGGGGSPDPPPQTYLKVAPRTANYQDGSDPRFCCEQQPGVVWDQASRRYRDDVATYDENGLCVDGKRTRELQVPGLPGAREMDGRGACDIAPVGDPYTNTGSWQV